MAALEDILQRHPVWRGGASFPSAPAVPSGFSVLDGELPGGGWPTGALTEILGLQQGIGELQLLLPVLAALTTAGKRVVWIAPPHLPYAPALAAAGVDLIRLAVVRAPGRRDSLWAAEQALRSGACHALLAWFCNARYAELRRLALAAEASRAFVALFRPREAAQESSPACLRIALEPVEGELAVRILKRHGAPAAAPLILPLKNPIHALGRSPFSLPALRDARARRSLGLPVHA
ncbi:MAG TPA: translesion DNA synthesis-associated protein ImuA [Burkholderiales bacterium]|nr:translesion DNA synthesis-associated protein ImuA [Burkholderiales bacterium]